MISGAHSAEALATRASEASRRAAAHLLSAQRSGGTWECDVASGAPLETDLILLEFWRHPSPAAPTAGRISRAVRNILARQLPDGGIATYPDGPSDLDATVRAYFALKLAGVPVDSHAMAAARTCILRLGGLHRTNPWTQLELSLFGVYDNPPALPPEMIFAPDGLNTIPTWMRARAIALAVLSASKGCRTPAGTGLGELIGDEQSGDPPVIGSGRVAALMRLIGRRPFPPVRARALRECKHALEQLPFRSLTAMRFGLMAAGAQAPSETNPSAYAELERLVTDDGERLRVRPCRTDVADTALVVCALAESGFDVPPGASEWLAAQDLGTQPADTTALAALALRHSRLQTERAIELLIRTQGEDGGWPAGETCPDTTGRVLQALCRAGDLPQAHPVVRRGVEYLTRTQELDGSWSGRWGVRYVYGTFLALRGLAAAGVDDREASVLRGGEWLRSVQNPDGGWGESCASYDGAGFVAARSTPSQTAWAIAGLIAGGDTDSMSVQNGIEWLIGNQDAGGCWHEATANATEIPQEMYLVRHSYSQAYPLLALAGYEQSRRGGMPARSSR